MGNLTSTLQKNNMKLLVLSLLVATVTCEADPQLLIGTYGAVAHLPTVKVVETPAEVKTSVVPYALHHPVLSYAGLGYGYHPFGLIPHVVAAPAATEESAVVEADRKKREAEAEADPWYVYSGLHAPLVHTAPITYSHAGHLGYHGVLGYSGLYGYHGLYGHPLLVPAVAAPAAEEAADDAGVVEAERKRRDADADPAVIASYSRVLTAPTPLIHAPAHVYSTYAHLPYAYTYAYGK